MEKIRILLDTDIGCDCDDAGALAVLHRLADAGKAEILGITHCASTIRGAITVKAINEWYKKPEIPIGRYSVKPFLEEDDYDKYASAIMKQYLKCNKMPEIQDSVKVMRKILSEHKSITIVTIGQLNNIAEFLKSQPDDISPLDGKEMMKRSVKEIYVMAGDFDNTEKPEWNIKLDCESAKYVAEAVECPIIYCGFEVGVGIKTGAKLMEQPDDNIIKQIYKIHSCGGLRDSWDPITVYCAIEKDSDHFIKSDAKKIIINDDGTISFAGDGKDCYVIKNRTDEEIRDEINKWMY